jgi:hypothetical protein
VSLLRRHTSFGFYEQMFCYKNILNALLLRNYNIKRNVMDDDKSRPKYQCLVTEFQGKMFTDGNETVLVRREMIPEFWWGNMKEVHR